VPGAEAQCKSLIEKTVAAFGRLDMLINNAGLMESKGRIVAVSSLGGKGGLPFNTSYTASKYALHGFYDSLRMEMQPHGVSVTVICPYWVVTEFHEAYLDKDGRPRGKPGRALYTNKMMTAEQCAAITLQAAYTRRREVLMGPGGLLVWLKLIAPGFLDRMTLKLILEPIAKRTRAGKIGA
jgi:short-subunit dehydrogenase